jgi:hypothetical protein
MQLDVRHSCGSQGLDIDKRNGGRGFVDAAGQARTFVR